MPPAPLGYSFLVRVLPTWPLQIWWLRPCINDSYICCLRYYNYGMPIPYQLLSIPAVYKPLEHQFLTSTDHTQCPRSHSSKFQHDLQMLLFHWQVWYLHSGTALYENHGCDTNTATCLHTRTPLLSYELTFSFATNSSIFTVDTVMDGSELAVQKSGFISNTGYIIQKDWTISLAKVCSGICSRICNKWVACFKIQST